jgi:uncharacterized BrkB/YihY/UPF0761 family membrane protein
VVPAHTPKASERARARVQAARALGERKFEQAQTFAWVRHGLRSFEHEQRSGASLLAGGLAYRFFFWLVSFGLVVAAAASFWVRSEGEGNLTDAAKSFGLSGIAARSAASAVHDGSRSRWYFLIAGVLLMIYFGTGGVRALRVTAIIAWRLDPTRMRHAFRASAIFTAVFALGLGITIFASWERHQSAGLGLAVTIGGIAAYVALSMLAFWALPHPRDIGWLALLPGALLVGAGVTAIHAFVVYYLSGKLERSPKLYGVLGASTVVLLALFLIARVIVSAMFLNATLERREQANVAS